jgi:hypothetical protein
MTITNKNIISFRCHRSMVSWVDTVVPLFLGGRSGFLRLLLVTMALEQTPPARGISKLFKKEPQLLELPIGNSCCFHVRVNDAVKTLIKEAATERGQTVGQWAATAMYNWRFRFKNYQDIKEQKEGIPRNRCAGIYPAFYRKCRQITVCIRSIKGEAAGFGCFRHPCPAGHHQNRGGTSQCRQKITVLSGQKG